MHTIRPVVLVVHDSPDTLELYREYLTDCGFRVLTAGDGEAAVHIARAQWPAAIVMGLEVAGWEAIRQLHADPLTADIPVVAVSVYAFPRQPVHARESGADTSPSKPRVPPQVARFVRAMITARTAERSTPH